MFFSKFPGQSSFASWKFIKQQVDTGKFLRYNFGEQGNLKAYGSKEPPEYDGAKVVHAGIPMILVAAKHDILVNYMD